MDLNCLPVFFGKSTVPVFNISAKQVTQQNSTKQILHTFWMSFSEQGSIQFQQVWAGIKFFWGKRPLSP